MKKGQEVNPGPDACLPRRWVLLTYTATEEHASRFYHRDTDTVVYIILPRYIDFDFIVGIATFSTFSVRC